MTHAEFTPDALDHRITVHEGPQTIELELDGLVFRASEDATAFYDHLEARIAETGESKWFFLVHKTDYRVWDEAWFSYTRRGRETHTAHSMGTVNVDESELTRRQIARTAGTDMADRNLFATREAAWAELKTRSSTRMDQPVHVPNHRRASFTRRFTFRPSEQRLDIDFAGVNLAHSRDVNDVYNWLSHAIRATGRKWWLLINYDGMRIQQGAWVAYDQRKTALEAEYALGTVRYAPGAETEADIRLRMDARGTRPNIRNTRQEALARLDELKDQALSEINAH